MQRSSKVDLLILPFSLNLDPADIRVSSAVQPLVVRKCNWLEIYQTSWWQTQSVRDQPEKLQEQVGNELQIQQFQNLFEFIL